ncbi:MAG: hypothetical protein JWR25_2098, partial [Noviherbaspirillum sp.]|nr:hypothetical protein [Noviherbaspirillum sp.]
HYRAECRHRRSARSAQAWQGDRWVLRTKGQELELFSTILSWFCLGKMSIVTLSDSLIQRLPPADGRILRDRTVCGLCLKVGKRNRTFLISTSVAGKQFRLTLGRWPLISVAEARRIALPILQWCRLGNVPLSPVPPKFPVLAEAIAKYCEAKKLRDSSKERYLSIVRTHFRDWQNLTVDKLADGSFAEHCHRYAQTKGAALVEVGRGLIGALFKYLNATYGLSLESPFNKLAAAGLMPERAGPRLRKLMEADLPIWKNAVERLPEGQRDYLFLICYTGLRRHECADITLAQVDFDRVFFSSRGRKQTGPTHFQSPQ